MKTATQLSREMMDACAARDYDRIRSLCHPEYLTINPDGGEHRGPEHVIKSVEFFLKAIPDVRFEATYHAVDDSLCVAEGFVRGTRKGDPPGSEPVTLRTVTMFESRDGLLWQKREYITGASVSDPFGLSG